MNTADGFDDSQKEDANDKDWVPSPTNSLNHDENSDSNEAAVASTVAALFQPLSSISNYVLLFPKRFFPHKIECCAKCIVTVTV